MPKWAYGPRSKNLGQKLMNTPRQAIKIVLPAIAAVFALIFSYEGSASDVGRHEAELKELRARIKDVTTMLDNDRGKMGRFSRELRDVESRMGGAISRLRSIDGQLQRQQVLIGELRTQEQRQATELERHRQLLSKQMLATYAMGRQERIKVLLNQEEPALLGRMLEYHTYLSNERARRIGRIREILKRLQGTREAIVQEESRLNELRDQALARKMELEKDKAEREGLLEELRKQISDKGKELTQLQTDVKELTKLIASLQDALADIPAQSEQNKPFDASRGRMPWPASGEMVANFGTPREAGLEWDGVFISVAEGREVKAIHSGRVAYAEWLRGFGLLLIIDHGNGYMSLYGHNQGLLKEVGDWVAAGEAIALAGSSGGQSKSGVYFGVRYKGKPLNPTSWCKPMKGNKIV
ncbi:MAG: peptidoglycan DD-metalloendopeptidase family protein [Gammaproteobacteria bacterium]|nr:peptidoglycan DD-metalloendopeptidase family protein [Gammaproteobacteria bacterium]MBU1656242.1 peptidoglycan DD-metalloendopeptidase family protein [Gammaproteobacteria bacterium]MBU1959807.1 peptidoglycan DD-metalloendopeptidase family protein [Gammaproteobacteria bacterium]